MTATELRADRRPHLPADGRRRRRIVVILAAVVVLALAGTWLVAFSSAFGVRSVQVRGTHVLAASDVERAADIEHGTPLVRLDTVAVAKRVEKLRVVASARVDTSFPSTVVVTVTERTPVGYVMSSGLRNLVDRTGEQYRSVRTVPGGLPKLVVPAGTNTHTTGGAVATVAASLPADLRSRVRSIEALDPDAITVVLRNDKLVRWGSAERSKDKARIVDVLRQRKHPSADQIDVTDPDQPFTR